jgi:site-specific DNA recombinase
MQETILQNQNRLIAIYARVSTSNQEQEGTIETQLCELNRFAKEKDYTIVQTYTDDGWSGDSLARPALDQMREDAKKKIWDAVLIYDPDRLARRYSYQELVMDELKERGVDVLFVTVPEAKTDEDKIMYGMRGLFAQYERVKITERFRLGKVRKAREGNVMTSEAPYGYSYIPKRGKKGDVDFVEGHYEINEYESDVVRKMFSWVADEGLALRGVVKRLQEQKILPRKSKRGVWNTSTLSTLLRNRTYIGEAHYGASYAVVPENPTSKEQYRKIKKTSRRMKPESEWIKIPVQGIIDIDLFDRVVKKLADNVMMSKRNTKNEYLLSRKIWCTCGCRRQGEGPLHGRYLYYRCTNRVKSSPLPPKCKSRGLNAREIDEIVWKKVAGLMSSPSLLRKQFSKWTQQKEKGSDGSSGISIDQTKKEAIKLRKQIERYTKAYGENVITLDQLKGYLEPIKERISVLNKQISKEGIRNQEVQPFITIDNKDISSFAIRAKKVLKNLNFKSKKAIVMSVIDKVVGTPEQLQIYGYIPVTNINVFTSNRNSRITKCGKKHSI